MLYLYTVWADRSSWLCGCDAAVLLLTSVLLVLIGPGGETDGESFSSHQRQTHRDLLKVKTDVFMLPVCVQCFTRIDRQHSHSHPQGQTVSDRPEVRYNAVWETSFSLLPARSSFTVSVRSRSGHIDRPHESSCFKTDLYLEDYKMSNNWTYLWTLKLFLNVLQTSNKTKTNLKTHLATLVCFFSTMMDLTIYFWCDLFLFLTQTLCNLLI